MYSLCRVLVHVRLELYLLLIHFYLVAVVVLHLTCQAVGYLVFLYIQAPLIHLCLANGSEFDLRSGPVGQDVVRLIKQVVEIVEVALYGYLHLIALSHLLPRNRCLFVRNFQNRAMVLSETSLLAKCALTFYVVSTVLLIFVVFDLITVSLGIASNSLLAIELVVIAGVHLSRVVG